MDSLKNKLLNNQCVNKQKEKESRFYSPSELNQRLKGKMRYKKPHIDCMKIKHQGFTKSPVKRLNNHVKNGVLTQRSEAV